MNVGVLAVCGFLLDIKLSILSGTVTWIPGIVISPTWCRFGLDATCSEYGTLDVCHK